MSAKVSPLPNIGSTLPYMGVGVATNVDRCKNYARRNLNPRVLNYMIGCGLSQIQNPHPFVCAVFPGTHGFRFNHIITCFVFVCFLLKPSIACEQNEGNIMVAPPFYNAYYKMNTNCTIYFTFGIAYSLFRRGRC